MHKVAVIGSKDAVLAFQSLGITVVPVSSPEEAGRAVVRLAQQQYAVIFITEDEAQQIAETISRYKSEALPAIIPIPGSTGSSGFGMRNVRANVEKAIGADILFNAGSDS